MRTITRCVVTVAIITVAALACAAPARAATDGTWVYTVNEGEAVITAYTGPGGDVEVPATVGGAQVTTIGPNAFNPPIWFDDYPEIVPDYSIKTITIPEGVRSLGAAVFRDCSALTDVVLPESITELPENACRDCRAITAIHNMDQITVLGAGAFSYSRIMQIQIPLGVTTVPSDLCLLTPLRAVSIPEGVTSLQTAPFEECSGLTQVKLPSTLESMGWAAFQGSHALRRADFAGNAPAMTGFTPGMTGAAFYNVADDFVVRFREGATGFPEPPGPWIPCGPDMFNRTSIYPTAYWPTDEPTHTVTVYAAAHGSASWDGDRVVRTGSNATVVFTPDDGYYCDEVIVDSESLGPRGSIAFTDIDADHIVTATFLKRRFTVEAEAGDHGSITPAGSASVPYGSNSTTYTFEPDPGYHLEDVEVDGVSVGTPASYVIPKVVTDHTIEAEFAWTKLPTETSLRLSAKSLRAGSWLTVNARLSGGSTYAPGTSLVLERKVAGGSYKRIATLQVKPDGSACTWFPVTTRGAFYYRVRFAGDAIYEPAPTEHGTLLRVR